MKPFLLHQFVQCYQGYKYAVCFTKYVTGFGVFVSRPYIDQYIYSVRLFTALGLTMGNLILQATSIIFEAPRQGLHSSCNCEWLKKDGHSFEKPYPSLIPEWRLKGYVKGF